MNTKIKKALQDQLTYIGDNPTREGLVGTPDRIIRMWEEDIFKGYKEDIPSLFTIFEEKYDQMVILKDIELYSMCEHHMLPFFGKAHIAYIPNGKVVGISKLARLLDAFARRLQIQERIGDQVVDAIMEHLQPLGAACIIEATHMCMRMRGVKKQNSIMVTSSVRGEFATNPSVKSEFLQLIHS